MNFGFQIMVWGYAFFCTGDSDFTRNPVYLCEGTWNQPTMWDNPKVLENTTINGERPPEWHALWWVGEHLRRLETV